MLLGTLGASLLGNLLTVKGVYRAGKGKGINRTLLLKQNGFLIPLHPLTNFDIQKYYQNEPRFNGVYYRDSPKKKDGEYVINLDEYSDIGTHWVALYVQNNNVTYFDSFGVKDISKEIRTFISRTSSSALHNKNIATNISEYKHMI